MSDIFAQVKARLDAVEARIREEEERLYISEGDYFAEKMARRYISEGDYFAEKMARRNLYDRIDRLREEAAWLRTRMPPHTILENGFYRRVYVP